jgi:hypothetical protein
MTNHGATEAGTFKWTRATWGGSLQVGEGRGDNEEAFPAYRWKEAILALLNGIWSGRREILALPKISLGNFPEATSQDCVELLLYEGQYYAAGTSSEEVPGHWKHAELLYCSPSQYDVESTLIRFVKNETIKAIRIDSASGGNVWLWKKDDGELGVDAKDIQRHPGVSFFRKQEVPE